MFQIEVLEKIKTHFLCLVFFFSKILPIMRYCKKKHGRARQATDDNLIQGRKDAICMPDN